MWLQGDNKIKKSHTHILHTCRQKGKHSEAGVFQEREYLVRATKLHKFQWFLLALSSDFSVSLSSCTRPLSSARRQAPPGGKRGVFYGQPSLVGRGISCLGAMSCFESPTHTHTHTERNTHISCGPSTEFLLSSLQPNDSCGTNNMTDVALKIQFYCECLFDWNFFHFLVSLVTIWSVDGSEFPFTNSNPFLHLGTILDKEGRKRKKCQA